MSLPTGITMRGKRLAWRHAPLVTYDPLTAWRGLLEARGLHESDPFFSPMLASLPDPMGMRDMDRAAARVAGAIRNGEAIHIFGDFDCDGVSGTAILVEALRAAGASVSFSIPHRADDGHGIGAGAVRQAFENGARLGISVDTGTTCFAACDAAAGLGFDLIVSDHHLPEEHLPAAYALLNPARSDCGFAGRQLCGTGVAFFLLMAVWKELGEARPAYDLRRLLDRVAVATIADVMDLVGVNRVLVHHGLQRLNTEPSTGMRALLDVARVKKRISAETIGFYLAPRINAAGRMQHGEEAMRLLCTDDADEARRIAEMLDATNKQRRQVEAEVFRQAEAMLGDADTLAVYHADWHAGVVGLAAGRLARKHHRPAAVGFITPDGRVRISLRGVPGFHIGDLLQACAEHLEGFGGHAGAGGGTVGEGAWEGFVQAFAAAIREQAARAPAHDLCHVDGMLGLGAMHAGLARRLQRFEPVGRGNPPCCWLLRDVHVADCRELKGGVVRLLLGDGRHALPAILFGGGMFREALQAGATLSVLGQLECDDWRGGDAVQFVVQDILTESGT